MNTAIIHTPYKLIHMLPVDCDITAKSLLTECWSFHLDYIQSRDILKNRGYLLTEPFYKAYMNLLDASSEDTKLIKTIEF